MVKPSITFIHGWGCGPDIWDALIDHLSDLQCQTVNLGFTGSQENIEVTKSEKSVYVTHSLGTMWALKNRYKQMHALIPINGFSCFKNFTQPHILKRMKMNLKQNSDMQMRNFWEASDLPESDEWNIENLYEGLGWLSQWDYTAALMNISCPVTAIFADSDSILDVNLMRKHWQNNNRVVIEDGGHALPITHSQVCADIIRKTIDVL